METDAKLQTRRPTKTPLHKKDKLKALLTDLQKNGLSKQKGSMLHEEPKSGYTSMNPLIINKTNDFIKRVLDARHLNSNTGQPPESCPLEPLAKRPARTNKKYESAFNLMYVYTCYIG